MNGIDLTSLLAIPLFLVIIARAICVLYMATIDKHGSKFVGLALSYVVFGSGAYWAMLALVARPDLSDAGLWMMLLGSTGMILYDKRHI